jgi:hypothetical protein
MVFAGGVPPNVAYCPFDRCDIVVGQRGTQTFPLITVSRVKRGLMLDAKVFDKDGNLIAKIVGDKPFVNRNFASDFNRVDEHSVWVNDNHDKRILYVRLLNQNSLRIEGTFNLPDEVRAPTPPHRSLVVSADSTVSPPGIGTTNDSCMQTRENGAVMVISEGH